MPRVLEGGSWFKKDLDHWFFHENYCTSAIYSSCPVHDFYNKIYFDKANLNI